MSSIKGVQDTELNQARLLLFFKKVLTFIYSYDTIKLYSFGKQAYSL